MKNAKLSVRLLVFLILALAIVLTMASCKKKKNDDHVHEYVASVTSATCTEQGFTTYTCECGDTYVDDYVSSGHNLTQYEGKEPTCNEGGWAAYEKCSLCDYTTYKTIAATGHRYEEKITRYPTNTSVGIVSLICSGCGDSTSEEIDAVSLTLPSVAEFLKKIVGSNTITVNTDDIQLIVLNKIERDNELTSTEENYLAIEVAKLQIDGKGEKLYANLSLNIGTTSSRTSGEGNTLDTTKLIVDLIVNGDNVFVTVNNNDTVDADNFDLSEAFYTALGNYIGVSYDELAEMIYIGKQAYSYLPLVEGIMGALESLELPELNFDLTLPSIVLGEDIIVANGNSYTLDLSSLAEYLESAQGKTLAQMIDEQYGAGTTENLKEFLISMPTTKIKDVAEYAVTLAENSGLEVDDIYAFINLLIYKAAGVDFNIESEILTRYNNTVAELIAELTMGSDATEAEIADTAAELVDNIKHTFNIYTSYTIDQLYNMLNFGNPNYSNSEGEVFSITESLLSVIDNFEDVVKFEMTCDDEGNVESIYAELDDIVLDCQITDDGKCSAELWLEYNYATLTIDGYNVNMTVYDGLDKSAPVLFEAKLTETVNGISETYVAEIISSGDTFVYVKVVNMNGDFYMLDADIYGYVYEYENLYNYDTGAGRYDETKIKYQALDVTVVKNNDGSYSSNLIAGFVSTSTESSSDGTVYYEKRTCTIYEEAVKLYVKVLNNSEKFLFESTLYSDGTLLGKCNLQLVNDDLEVYVESNGKEIFNASVDVNENELLSVNVVANAPVKGVLVKDESVGNDESVDLINVITFNYTKGEGDAFDVVLVLNRVNYFFDECYFEEYEEWYNTQCTDSWNELDLSVSYTGNELNVKLSDIVLNANKNELNDKTDYIATITCDEYEYFKASVTEQLDEIVAAEVIINALVSADLEGYDLAVNLLNILTLNYVKGEGDAFDFDIVIKGIDSYSVAYDYEVEGWYYCDDLGYYYAMVDEYVTYLDVDVAYDGDLMADAKVGAQEFVVSMTETEDKNEFSFTATVEEIERLNISVIEELDKLVYAAITYDDVFYGEVKGYTELVNVFNLFTFELQIGDNGEYDMTLLVYDVYDDGHYDDDLDVYVDLMAYENDLEYKVTYDGESDLFIKINQYTFNGTLTVTEDQFNAEVSGNVDGDELVVTMFGNATEAKISVTVNGDVFIYADAKEELGELTYLEYVLNIPYEGEVNGYEELKNLFNLYTFRYAKGEGDAFDLKFVLNNLTEYKIYNYIGDICYITYETEFVGLVDFELSYNGSDELTVGIDGVFVTVSGNEIENGVEHTLTITDGEEVLADLVIIFTEINDGIGAPQLNLGFTGEIYGKDAEYSVTVNDGYFNFYYEIDGRSVLVYGSNEDGVNEFEYHSVNGEYDELIGFVISTDDNGLTLEFDVSGLTQVNYSDELYWYYDEYWGEYYEYWITVREESEINLSGKVTVTVA